MKKIIIAIILSFSVFLATAKTTTFTGGPTMGSTDWSAPANWDNGVPENGDDVRIGTVASFLPVSVALDASVTATNFNSLIVGGMTTLNISNGVSLTVATPIEVKSGGTIIDFGSNINADVTIETGAIMQTAIEVTNPVQITGNVKNSGHIIVNEGGLVIFSNIINSGGIDSSNGNVFVEGNFNNNGGSVISPERITVKGEIAGIDGVIKQVIPSVPLSPWGPVVSVFLILGVVIIRRIA